MNKFLAGTAAAGVLATVAAASAVAFGTASPGPPLHSVTDLTAAIDRRGMPAVRHAIARDGTALAFRLYPAPGSRRVAILYHGASDSSQGMHAVATALQSAGITACAVDTRGHGGSGTRGDVAYVGQLEDDLHDLLTHLRARHPGARFSLVGHSSGGGFVLRVAGSPGAEAFDRFVLTAPYLHHQAPTSRGADGGGWASPYVPRLTVLGALDAVGVDAFGGLPVIAFAVAPEHPGPRTYSYRLFRNYAPHRNYVGDAQRSPRPIHVIAGSADEVFRADRYADAFAAAPGRVAVRLLPGLGHMAMVSDPAALAAVTAAVARAGD